MKRLSSYFNKKKNFKQLLIMMIRKKEKWKKTILKYNTFKDHSAKKEMIPKKT